MQTWGRAANGVRRPRSLPAALLEAAGLRAQYPRPLSQLGCASAEFPRRLTQHGAVHDGRIYPVSDAMNVLTHIFVGHRVPLVEL